MELCWLARARVHLGLLGRRGRELVVSVWITRVLTEGVDSILRLVFCVRIIVVARNIASLGFPPT